MKSKMKPSDPNDHRHGPSFLFRASSRLKPGIQGGGVREKGGGDRPVIIASSMLRQKKQRRKQHKYFSKDNASEAGEKERKRAKRERCRRQTLRRIPLLFLRRAFLFLFYFLLEASSSLGRWYATCHYTKLSVCCLFARSRILLLRLGGPCSVQPA